MRNICVTVFSSRREENKWLYQKQNITTSINVELLLTTIQNLQLRGFGHSMRMPERFLCYGRRSRGKPKCTWEENIVPVSETGASWSRAALTLPNATPSVESAK